MVDERGPIEVVSWHRTSDVLVVIYEDGHTVVSRHIDLAAAKVLAADCNLEISAADPFVIRWRRRGGGAGAPKRSLTSIAATG